MFSYMIDAKSVGCYREGFNQSINCFRSKNPAEMAKNSGAIYKPESSIITLHSLKQPIDVHFPDGRILFANSNLSPIWPWCLIILNYLYRADDTMVFNKLVSYRELEGGDLYYSAFFRNSIAPLATKLSHEPSERIERACLEFTDNLQVKEDICAVFDFLPRFPVTVKIWLHDEEVGGSANILFDASANHYLHTEDIAAVGDIISYFLLKQCNQRVEPKIFD